MNPDSALDCTRRHFFGRTATGIGMAALASLLQRAGLRGEWSCRACRTSLPRRNA